MNRQKLVFKILSILAIFCIMLSDCKKSSNDISTNYNSVIINGKAYQTAIIGGQIWTTENYDGPGGIVNPDQQEAIYGKFYTLSEAKAVNLPSGWRVPSRDDFKRLLASQGDTTQDFENNCIVDTIGAAHLRSRSNWTLPGDNLSGFNAQPSGDYNYYLKKFENVYAYATFWSTTFETHGINPSTETVLVLNGYRDSAGLLYRHEVAAYTSNQNVDSEIDYNLRFVKDN